MSLEDFAFTAFALRMVRAVVAVVCLFIVLRVLDWSIARAQKIGRNFGSYFEILTRSPEALSRYLSWRYAATAFLFAMVLGGCTSPAGAQQMTLRYDHDIRRAVDLYWGDYPHWAAWKGQLYQESRLDPAAVSPVGAAGLAQFMPGTWDQVKRELRLPPDARVDSRVAIEAGAYYMAQLRRQWSAPRPAEDRQRLAQASYNAGLGNILAAQRVCGGPPLYRDIIACLPRVTGRHSAETITYVDRIARWRAQIEAGL